MNKFECEQGIVYNGDCLEIMDYLIKQGIKVDAVITDPPYGTTDCKWDSIVDFNILKEKIIKITKDKTNIIFFGNEPFSTRMRITFMDLFKYDMIWVKNRPTGFQHAKNMPMRKFENIMVYSKNSMGHESLLGDNRMVYNPQGLIRIDKKLNKGMRSFNNVFGKRPSHKDNFIQEYTNYPDNVLIFSKEDDHLHPTQKPILLMEYLIKTFTNENSIILDCFSGSGSTLIGCMNTNRKFIGIEKEEKYFNITIDRIKENINNKKEIEELNKINSIDSYL